jgi:hypothetical protein
MFKPAGLGVRTALAAAMSVLASLEDVFGPPVAPVVAPDPSAAGVLRRRSREWSKTRAPTRRAQRWAARAQAARTLLKPPRPVATVASIFDGIITFKMESASGRGGRKPVNWASVMRIVTSPSNVASATMASIAFGGLVSDASVRRTRVRIACSLDLVLRGKVRRMLDNIAPRGTVAEPVVIGQLWKFDDTEVRWRTLNPSQGGASGAYGTTCLVQRGWLCIRIGDATKRIPIPVPVVPLPSHSAKDLFVNLQMPLCSKHLPAVEAVAPVPGVAMYVADAAGCNKCCLAQEIQATRGRHLILYAPCLAHQLHLCSRTQYIAMGTSFVTYIAQCAHVWHVGRYHQDLLRCFLELVARNIQIVVPASASGNGGHGIDHVPASASGNSGHCIDHGPAGQRELLIYLVTAAKGGMPDAVLASIDVVTSKLNSDWSAPDVIHVCRGCCQDRAHLLQQLLPALRAILGTQPVVASAARWTDTYRSVAAQSLWLLFHGLGPLALAAMPQAAVLVNRASTLGHSRGGSRARGRRGRAPGRRGRGAGRGLSPSVVDPDSEMSFAERMAKRLGFVRKWWSAAETLPQLLILLIANHSIRRYLLWVFKVDAHTYPDIRDYADRSGAFQDGGIHTSGARANKRARQQAHHGGCQSQWQPPASVALTLATGVVAERALIDGCAPLRDPATLPQHFLYAWKRARQHLAGAQSVLQCALIPGMAQLWFRGKYMYTTWPWPLLRLLDNTFTGASELAEQFMFAKSCCLDPGFSVPLHRHLCSVVTCDSDSDNLGWRGATPSGGLEEQKPTSVVLRKAAQLLATLSDPICRAVLQLVSEDLEASVIDVECRHARHRRTTVGPGGRPPNFATVAARCYLRECALLHSQVTGTVPDAHFNKMLLRAQSVVKPPVAMNSKKVRKANPYFAFRANQERLYQAAPQCAVKMLSDGGGLADSDRATAISLVDAIKPRTTVWEQAVSAAYAALSQEDKEQWRLHASAQVFRGDGTSTAGTPPHDPLSSAVAVAPPVAHVARCNKRGCALLLGTQNDFISRDDVLAVSDDPAVGGTGGKGFSALETAWNTRLNFTTSAPRAMKCPSWYRTCVERGVCADSFYGKDVIAVCSAINRMVNELSPKVGTTIWALQYKLSAVPELTTSDPQWLYFQQASGFCIAHILWVPRRVIVVPVPMFDAFLGSAELQYTSSGSLDFQLLEHLVMRLFLHKQPTQIRLVTLSSGACVFHHLWTGKCGTPDVVGMHSSHVNGQVGTVFAALDDVFNDAPSHGRHGTGGTPKDMMQRHPRGTTRRTTPVIDTTVGTVIQRCSDVFRDPIAEGPAVVDPVIGNGTVLQRCSDIFHDPISKGTPVADPVSDSVLKLVSEIFNDLRSKVIPPVADTDDRSGVERCRHPGCMEECWAVCSHCEVGLCYVHLGMDPDQHPQLSSRCHDHCKQLAFACPCLECKERRAARRAQPVVVIPSGAEVPVVIPSEADFPVVIPSEAEVPVVVPSQAEIPVVIISSDSDCSASRPHGGSSSSRDQCDGVASPSQARSSSTRLKLPHSGASSRQSSSDSGSSSRQSSPDSGSSSSGSSSDSGPDSPDTSEIELGASEVDASVSKAALAEVSVPERHGPTRGRGRGRGRGGSRGGSEQSQWSGFTDKDFVVNVLKSEGLAPPPPGYKIYQTPERWHARFNGGWLTGSSRASSRFSDENAILAVHAVCMQHHAGRTGSRPASARARASASGRPGPRGRARGRGNSVDVTPPVAPVAAIASPEVSDADDSASVHSSEFPLGFTDTESD